MPSIVLQQVSSPFARKNAKRTLEKDVALRFIEKHLEPSVAESLHRVVPNGLVRIWGAKLERSHQWVKTSPRNSFVLFRRGNSVFAHAVIAETTFNESLALSLWGRDTDGETWPFILFFTRLIPLHKDAATFNKILGRKENDHWQGMTVIYLSDSPALQAYLSSGLDA